MTSLSSRLNAWVRIVASWALAHKKLAALGVACALLIGGSTIYALSRGGAQTKYVLATADTGTVVVSLSGTGQVSASNQVTLTSKASGQLVAVNAVAGQTVRAGATIAQVDATEAGLELENAKLSYEKLTTIDTPNNQQDAKQSLADAYQTARATLSSASTDLRTVADALEALYAKDGYLTSQRYDVSDAAKAERADAEHRYGIARASLDSFEKEYASMTDSSDDSAVDTLLGGSATKAGADIADAAKAAKDTVTYMRTQEDNTKVQTEADSAFTSITSSAALANSSVSSIAAAVAKIRTAKQGVADVTGAVSTIDARASMLTLRQKQDAYDDYFVTAPFDGILAALSVHQGDTVNSGTTIGTFITKQKLAEISLNEVDAAKVKIGQKATLTFDAIDGLSISGTVAEVDYLGTVSQGVVNYTVKVAFDTDDDRIKPGMTVTANIVTDIAQDVLTVPVGAVKTSGTTTYVEVLDNPPANPPASGVVSQTPPRQVEVTVGLEDDALAEITAGLTAGETVVAKTVTGSTKPSTAANTTRSGSLFGGATGGSAVRATTRTFSAGGPTGP